MLMSEQKDKGLLPVLRFPQFRDRGGWEEKKLGELDDVRDGTHDSPKFFREGKPLVTSKNLLEDGSLDLNNVNLICKEDYEQINKRSKVDVGDVLFGMIGTIGNPVMVRSDGFAIKNVALIKQKTELLNSYLVQLLRSQHIAEKLSVINSGNSQKFVALGQLRNLSIPTPRIPEQQKIADCLTSVDELITVQTQKLDALKTHKKGLMQQLFPAEGETTPKLRFPEFRDKGEWSVKLLGKVADNLDFKRIPITEADRVKGAFPYYGASGVIDYVEGYIFDEELLCISEDGANLVTRTYPIAFTISGKTWVNNHVHVLKFEHRFTQIIVENYLNAINLEDFLTGMAQPKLNQAKLEIIPIPLPDNGKEQQRIADCLTSIDDLIAAQTQKLDILKTHKKGLMQQLFPAIDDDCMDTKAGVSA